MAKLPQNLTWDMASNRWSSQIEPIINNPVNNSITLTNVALITGDNSIDHRLGRKLQGWQISRLRGAATIYDTQDANQRPDLTLSLVSSADVTVNLVVW